MKICVVGTGYVGLVAGAGFADFGNDVICADVDPAKIAALKEGKIPIYEPGLEPLVQENVRQGRLTFTTDVAAAVRDVDAVFVAVGTPPGPDGSADLSQVWEVARLVAKHATGFTVVVNKSTVPVGTGDRVAAILEEEGNGKEFGVVSNPEFLKEGDAVSDFMRPPRVVIGTDDERAAKLMRHLYAPFLRVRDRLVVMSLRSAEVTKYACNSMLATRISFMNEMAAFCQRVGASIDDVRYGMAWDDRIGPKFLFPGVGYGGSCFPKDVKAILATAKAHDLPLQVIQSVHQVNEKQKEVLADMSIRYFNGRLTGKTIALWGLAFKPKTDDVREAPAKSIADKLIQAGAKLQLHDPVARETFEQLLPASNRVQYFDRNYDALKGADALLVVTEWQSYRVPDFARMKDLMRSPNIFDGRNIWEPELVRELGFHYESIGRP